MAVKVSIDQRGERGERDMNHSESLKSLNIRLGDSQQHEMYFQNIAR